MKVKKIWRNKLSLLAAFISVAGATKAKPINEIPGTDFYQTIWNNSSGSISKYGDGVTITTSGSGNGAGIGANAGVYSNFGGDLIVGDRLTITTSGTAADAIRTNPSGANDYNNSVGIIKIGDYLKVSVSGLSADGVNANGHSTVIIGNDSDFTVGGLLGYAVRANQNSDVTVGDRMKIQVNNSSSYAVFTDRGSASTTGYVGGSSISIGNDSDIKTVGSSAHAVYLNNINSSITFKDNTKIVTDGSNSDGIVISTNGSNGLITIGNNLNIETLKEKSDGVVLAKNGIINIGNDFKIKTNANESTGITSKDESKIIMGENTVIDTLGEKSHGVFINNNLTGVVQSESLSLKTSGEMSDSILIFDGGNVDVKQLNIETLSASSYGMHLIGDGASVVSTSSGSIHSEGTAIKFQSNELGTLGQKVTLKGTTITNNGVAASIILGSNTDVDNSGNLIQVGGLTAINGNNDSVINATLNIYDSTLTAGGNKDLLNVSNNSSFLLNSDNTALTGNIETSSDSYVTVNLENSSILQGATNNISNINNLDMNIIASTWQMTDNSWVNNINNSGTISYMTLGDILTVNGNYTGNNGVLNIKTVLEDDNSITNKLHVLGDTFGDTLLNVENVGGNGAPTIEGIKVVEVDGTSNGNFSLSAPVQAGLYEYTLHKDGLSTPNDGDWYLRSYYYEEEIPTVPEIPEEPGEPSDPKDPNEVIPPKPDPIIIYRPGVTNYVAAQAANAEQGMLQLSTYHQRMGKQDKGYTQNKQTWVRTYGSHQNNHGDTRFDYKQTITGVQMGMDLFDHVNTNGTINHAGLLLDYSYANSRFFDDLRPESSGKYTGRMHARSAALGGYYTRISDNMAYLDVVGMVSILDNNFKDSYGEKSSQDGWRLGISAEAGVPFINEKGWGVEPQIQLMYQYTDYDSFNDSHSHIEGYNVDMLRGRGGFRVFKEFNNKESQVYTVANVVHDFTNFKDLKIDNTSIGEKYDRTHGEVGLGFNLKADEKTSIYSDVRYKKSFEGGMESAVFNIGFKTEF